MSDSPTLDDDTLLSGVQVRQMLGNVTRTTLWRWKRDEALEFPQPHMIVRGKDYWKLSAIRAWRDSRPTAA